MQPILETPRLYLRQFQIEDATAFYNLNLDPEVIRYTGDPPFESVAQAQDFLKNYSAYADYGYGRWAVCLKSNREFIGFCGLKYHPAEQITELGFRFFKAHWNQGFATESGQGCLNYGFESLKLDNIYAHAHIENTGSDRVLQKLGFTRLKRITYDSNPAYLYSIAAQDYE